MFRRSLGQLKQDIVKANALVQEANFLAEETGRMTKFSVTLQIPPANLGPNRKVFTLLVRHNFYSPREFHYIVMFGSGERLSANLRFWLKGKV